jgi:hypothetical protein
MRARRQPRLAAALLLLALAGCRTALVDPSGDGAAPLDLSSGGDSSRGHCIGPMDCGSDEICVYLERGDCSSTACVPVPPRCQADPTCGCLGNAFCPRMGANPNETEVCLDDPGFGPPNASLRCMSNIICVK